MTGWCGWFGSRDSDAGGDSAARRHREDEGRRHLVGGVGQSTRRA